MSFLDSLRDDISTEPLFNKVANLVPSVLKYLRTRLTDGTNELAINADGSINVSGSTIPDHDEYDIGYNANGTIDTIVYKLASATVATATFTYINGTSRIATMVVT